MIKFRTFYMENDYGFSEENYINIPENTKKIITVIDKTFYKNIALSNLNHEELEKYDSFFKDIRNQIFPYFHIKENKLFFFGYSPYCNVFEFVYVGN